MKFRKPYKRHHRRRDIKKEINWGTPKKVQIRITNKKLNS